ncbi:MAG: hypothetical protein ACRC1T_04810 [Clostridium chrysemydis]|uniref:hypothetical protein n=1 Tax=Clostridium chrysemydis TaxID=2665504 RepID=UPI003F2C0593
MKNREQIATEYLKNVQKKKIQSKKDKRAVVLCLLIGVSVLGIASTNEKGLIMMLSVLGWEALIKLQEYKDEL